MNALLDTTTIPDFYRCETCGCVYNSSNRRPHHLPCDEYHRICGTCLCALLESSNVPEVVCPHCFQAHPAISGVNSFYIVPGILRILRRRNRNLLRIEMSRRGIDIQHLTHRFCEEHNKPISFYCMGSRCNVALCITCLVNHINTESTSGHAWLNIRNQVTATVRFHVNRGIAFLERALQQPVRD